MDFFVQVYEINKLGLKAQYLTDSANFVKYIGDWDDEHETYFYKCTKDSIHILKTIRGNRWAKWDTALDGKISLLSNLDTVQNYSLNISQLQKLNNYKPKK